MNTKFNRCFISFLIVLAFLSSGCSYFQTVPVVRDYDVMSDKEVAAVIVDVINVTGQMEHSGLVLSKFESSLSAGGEVNVAFAFADIAKELRNQGFKTEAETANYISLGLRAARFPSIIPKEKIARALNIVTLVKNEIYHRNAIFRISDLGWSK